MSDTSPHIARVGAEEFAFLEPGQRLIGFEVLRPKPASELLRRIPPWKLPDLGRHDGVLADLVALGLVALARRRLVDAPLEFPETASDLADLAEPPEAPVEPEAAPIQTFAGFRLIDDLGNPIPDHDFTLDLPDGRTVGGRTGPDGRFEIEPVDSPGNCVLRFASPE